MSQDYSKCHILTVVLSVDFDAALSRQRGEKFTTQILLLHFSAMSWPSLKSVIRRERQKEMSVISPHAQTEREWQLLSEALWALEGHLVLKRGPEEHSSGINKNVAFNNNNWDWWSHKEVSFSNGGSMFSLSWRPQTGCNFIFIQKSWIWTWFIQRLEGNLSIWPHVVQREAVRQNLGQCLPHLKLINVKSRVCCLISFWISQKWKMCIVYLYAVTL